MSDQISNNFELDGFEVFLKNKGLKEKSIKDDFYRIMMMIKRNIDFTKGEDHCKVVLYNSDLSKSTITSCLRVCRYYKDYIEQGN